MSSPLTFGCQNFDGLVLFVFFEPRCKINKKINEKGPLRGGAKRDLVF